MATQIEPLSGASFLQSIHVMLDVMNSRLIASMPSVFLQDIQAFSASGASVSPVCLCQALVLRACSVTFTCNKSLKRMLRRNARHSNRMLARLMSALSIALLASMAATLSYGAEAVDNSELLSYNEAPIKFSLTSDSWGGNVNTGIRLFANNVSQRLLHLNSVFMAGDEAETRLQPEEDDYMLTLDVDVRAGKWAEVMLDFIDLSFGTDCIEEALHGEGSQWKLVEISNYALNPSVRSRIIEDTNSFRIFSCPRQVRMEWLDPESGQSFAEDIWVLYHFETKLEG